MPPGEVSHRLAFSYQRVSSGPQLAGDGIDRQADAFEPFCRQQGLTPAPEALQDRGLSAFSGKHRRKGALGGFLAAAKAGAVPPGSVLVVEDLSRFSREAPSDALRMLLVDLFGEGLALGVCRFGAVIDERAFNEQAGAALQLQIAIQLAHDESRNKGAHSRRNWARRHAASAAGQKDPSPRCRPAWLDWDAAAGCFRENALAALPRRAVELCLAGYGQNHAARLLTEEGHRNSAGKEITANMVSVMLRDRRLIGERRIRSKARGEETVLPGYFPPLVSAADFERVQSLMAERDRAPGRHGKGDKMHHLFAGVLFCSCGRLLTLNRQHGGRYLYLRCRGRLDGRCPHHHQPLTKYDEEHLLRTFMAQRWADYFHRPADSKARRKVQAETLEAEHLHRQQEANAATAAATMGELLTSGRLDPEAANLLTAKVKEAKAQAAATADRLAALQSRLLQIDSQPTGATMQRQIREKVGAFLATDRLDPAERRAFNNWLSTLGVRLVFDGPTGFEVMTATLPDGRLELFLDDRHEIERADGTVVEVKGIPSSVVVSHKELEKALSPVELRHRPRS